jgi:hypothetical protein
MSAAGLVETSHALHTIAALPLDPQLPLFRHYPAMKLGARAAVDSFVERLVPRVRALIAEHPARWVVTVPPLFVLPAGANLIARGVCRELARLDGYAPPLVELRYSPPDPATEHLEVPAEDYSRSGVAERVKSRAQLYEGRSRIAIDAEQFRGRAVLFVNDINVTGTQQHFMRRALAPTRPESLHWLHVLQVDPELGRAHPELEYALNHLHLASFAEFAELVADPGTEHTARCADRILGGDPAALAPVLRRLGPAQATRLAEQIAEEVRWKASGADHRARAALLARLIS